MRNLVLLGLGAIAACAACAALSASNAYAQQYSPLCIAPKLNLTVAVDTSHEMAHAFPGGGYNPGFTGNYLAAIRDNFVGTSALDPAAAIFPFRNEFLWSGFAYSGAQFAKIKDGVSGGPFNTVNTIRTPPSVQTPLTIQTSYTNVRNMVGAQRPDHCNATKHNPACTENSLPGGATLACITADCTGDQAVLDAVVTGGLSGFSLPTGLGAMTFTTAIVCDNPTYPSSPTFMPAVSGAFSCDDATPGAAPWAIRPICELEHELSYFSWPRFSPPGIPAVDVRDQLCDPLSIAFANVQAKINDCLATHPTIPDLTPAPSPGTGPGGYQCHAGNISTSVCSGSSPFDHTCVCDQSDPRCGGTAIDSCGVPMTLKARQQVAMCFSHNPDPSPLVSPIFNGLKAQTDNTLAGASGCRGNSILYLTDGLGGDSTGVYGNSLSNLNAYRTWDPPSALLSLPQNFVLEVGGRSVANDMQDIIQDTSLNGHPAAAVDGVNTTEVRGTLGRLVQRNLRGTYTAASIATDRFETRAAFLIYEVPGAPDPANDAYSTYLGRPTRIAWHKIRDDGSIDTTPLWESDYASRAGISATGGPTEVIMSFLASGPTPDPSIGPSGTWASGLPKDIFRNSGADHLDRNGDGSITGADNTPEPVRWGYMLGGENAAPVIVEAPRDVPIGGTSGGGFARYQAIRAISERPSTILAYTNGWIVGLYGGSMTRAPYLVNNTKILKTYQDDMLTPGARYDALGMAGRELFRIRPSFLYAPGNPSASLVPVNEALQQPLMNGQMIVREVLMSSNPERYSTVLIFMQGSAGRGIAAVDLTDPERGNQFISTDTNAALAFDPAVDGPKPMWELLLPDPADRATAKPVIYSFPQPKLPATIDQNRVTLLVTVGGAGGTNNIYGYRVRDGSLYTQTTLPSAAGQSYRTAPSCVDTDGRGASFCYLVRSDGLLVRVPIDRVNGAFGTAVSLSSAMVGGGRQFWTEPVLTFAQDNSVVVFAASGDINSMSAPTSTNNAMFKLVDRSVSHTGGTIDFGTVCAASGSGSHNGNIAFDDPHEMVLAPPTLVKGVLGYTTYLPGTDACTAGQAKLYTMNYESCADATRGSAALRPAGRTIGTGVPASPSILHRVESVVTHTSKEPTAAQARVSNVNSKGGTLLPVQRSYYAPLRIVK